nr:HlyD family secretion protein [Chelatococcus reniformis]
MPRTAQFQPGTDSADGETAQAASRPRRNVLKRGAIALALLAGTALAADYGYAYWTTGQYLQSTDDAYVKADYTIVAPKISGYIADVLVADNEAVKAGQALARIDDRDVRAALAQARADDEAAAAAIRNLEAQLTLQQSVIAGAEAAIAATQANLTFAQADAARYRNLVNTGAGTLQKAQETQATATETAAQLRRDQAALAEAKAKVPVLGTQRDQAKAQKDHAAAALRQAELNLSYTTIAAPVDGTVGARSLRVGQYVSAGTQLMAVVPLGAVYVVANYKETQLAAVRPGQAVAVEVDTFPGVRLTGHVDSLSPASGLEFSLLPPDNATGNFTKIVQRIPVRITLDASALTGLLRAGMSVQPSIDTKPEVMAERHAAADAAAPR